MRIGLISDTHIREPSEHLPLKVEESFQNVNLILHAGDIYDPSVLDALERIAPVLAAAGDDDCGATIKDRRVKTKYVFPVGEKVVWLLHDSALYYSYKSGRITENLNQGESEIPDIVVFGHTHYPIVESHQGILFINPGSAMSIGNDSDRPSVAILNIESGEVKVHILTL
jgi:putative phosphoesterase